MAAFKDFSMATGLDINPAKCKVYFGNVDENTKQHIQNIISFSQGSLPRSST